mmetsp:Transcript_40762/g.134913  ORF Transcript_40762/g.134913 Transcript_40762/m.134913 type:complete len:274 (-) Transcript_40762:1041-1862(-)
MYSQLPAVAWTSQSAPSATQMLNTLLANACTMAMAASPCRAARTLAYMFGKEVPAAPSVSPIAVEEKPIRHPIASRQVVITVARTTSQTSDISSVRANHFFQRAWRASGVVMWMGAASGKSARYATRCMQPDGSLKNSSASSSSSSSGSSSSFLGRGWGADAVRIASSLNTSSSNHSSSALGAEAGARNTYSCSSPPDLAVGLAGKVWLRRRVGRLTPGVAARKDVALSRIRAGSDSVSEDNGGGATVRRNSCSTVTASLTHASSGSACPASG